MNSDLKQKIIGHALRSQGEKHIRAMIALAQSEPEIAVTAEDFDAPGWLLNCRNGVLDLQTGILHPHHRDYLMTMMADVDYLPGSSCPVFERFIRRITCGDSGLERFLKRLAGYILTGDTREQHFFLLIGQGSNGKSTFLEILRSLLGDYARQTDYRTFAVNNNGVRNDLARLKGTRLATAVEIPSEMVLDEVLVKQITGGDTIAARFLYQEFFEFRPQFKVLLAANHKPVIKGCDHGIWRRILVIPFNAVIHEDESDPRLLEELKQELPGILNWAMEGCLEWQGDALAIPEVVREASGAYQDSMNPVAQFVADRCKLEAAAKTSHQEGYACYLEWAMANHEAILSKRQLNQAFAEMGIQSRKSTGGMFYWFGMRCGRQNLI